MAATRFGTPPGKHGWVGSLAERAELSLGATDAGARYIYTDFDGREDEWDGDEWQSKKIGGGDIISEPTLNMQPYYGGEYTYLCEASPGSALSDAVWRVTRVNDSTGQMVLAGTGQFEHAATDLATVAALTYTLGA